MIYSTVVLAASALLSSLSLTAAYTDRALEDQITDLPGAEGLDIEFNQFSGYLTINEETGKNIFYWFVEAENDPANAPVVFWTNGGPGCSGLIGFMTEQGPFRPIDGGAALKLNEFAWNKVANMVFIEQPSGVGYSYSLDKDDYRTNDQQAAQDNYQILQQFLVRFPEYKSNPMYSSAESYGGHFMPQLARQVVTENANPDSVYPKLNYKGFLVGNPFTDHYSEYPAMFYTYWGHQLISKPSWDNYQTTCVNVSPQDRNYTSCELIEIEMGRQVSGLNPYALDYPVCVGDSGKRHSRAQMTWAMNFMLPDHLKEVMAPGSTDDYEPCAADYMVNYLNREDVKKAVHALDSIEWVECATQVHYNMADRLIPMQPIYKELLASDSGLNILVYSGDDDAVCGTIGTQEWIWGLGYAPVSKAETWQPWSYADQVAGYATKFNIDTGKDNQFTFLTVHKAGHEVPTYVPEQALDMFEKYLNGYWSV